MSAGVQILDGVTYDVVPRVVAPPPPPPPPPHGQRRIMWRYGWSPVALSSWPADVRGPLTTVVAAMSQSAAAGTGRLTMPPGLTTQERAALVADGVEVFAGVGGSGDGGITITTPGQVTQAIASAMTMRDAGYTGICWDLEGAPGNGWNADALTDASRALVAEGIKVAIWSSLYGGRLAGWGAVARSLGDDLDHWQRGFYDFGEANDGRLTGIVTGDVARMRPFVSRDDQIVCSFSPLGSRSATPVPVMAAAYAAARKTLRPGSPTGEAMTTIGWSMWTDKVDAVRGWTATRALVKV